MSSRVSRPGHDRARPPGRRDASFTIRRSADDRSRTVRLSGELDVVSRAAVLDACTAGAPLDVRVDLSGVVFMDCAGYGALVAGTHEVASRGGTLVLANPSAESQRLLTLIDSLGRRRTHGPGECASGP